MKRSVIILVISLALGQISLMAQDEARLLRFPAIYDNQIIFTYAGDLYTVSADGGIARKLTNHNGYEMFARFSTDGKTVAFTAQYDGNTEVYTMNSQGGIPKRITYTATLGRDDVSDRMGPNNIVFGWMHNNKTVIFRSREKSFNDFNGSLYRAEDFAPSLLMIRKWHITVCSESSEHGRGTEEEWQMISGSSISKPIKQKTLPIILHRT
jgi:tricorn protease